jgi:hypothetical protein
MTNVFKNSCHFDAVLLTLSQESPNDSLGGFTKGVYRAVPWTPATLPLVCSSPEDYSCLHPPHIFCSRVLHLISFIVKRRLNAKYGLSFDSSGLGSNYPFTTTTVSSGFDLLICDQCGKATDLISCSWPCPLARCISILLISHSEVGSVDIVDSYTAM